MISTNIHFPFFFNQKVHLKFILFVHGVQSQRYLVLSVNLFCFHGYQELIFRFLSCLIALNDSLPCNDKECVFLYIGLKKSNTDFLFQDLQLHYSSSCFGFFFLKFITVTKLIMQPDIRAILYLIYFKQFNKHVC